MERKAAAVVILLIGVVLGLVANSASTSATIRRVTIVETPERWGRNVGPDSADALWPENNLKLSAVSVAAPSRGTNQFSGWLGSQDGKATNAVSVPAWIDQNTVEVMSGESIMFDESAIIVTCVKGRVTATTQEKLSIKKSAKYVVGRLKTNQHAQAVYHFDVIVTDGPLETAVVHFRDGTLPLVGGDKLARSMMCAYEIPPDLAIEAGPLKYKVVMVVYK